MRMNEYIFIFLLMLFATTRIFGQEEKTSKKNRNLDIKIGASLSGDMSYFTFIFSDTPKIYREGVRKRNSPKLACTAGTNIIFGLNEKVELQSGVQYSNKGYQTKRMLPEVLSDDGIVLIPEMDARIVRNYHFLDIPVQTNFLAGKKRVKFISSIGLVMRVKS